VRVQVSVLGLLVYPMLFLEYFDYKNKTRIPISEHFVSRAGGGGASYLSGFSFVFEPSCWQTHSCFEIVLCTIHNN
jgi:hypothetical protein